MKEAKIKTTFGDIRITYNSIDELNLSLQGLNEEIKIISDATTRITPSEPRLPKPGYENTYRFLPNGSVELLYHPSVSLHLAALALFAYHLESVNATELEKITTINDVANKVLWQTKNKKYFRKTADLYGLSPEGLQLVAEKIKPLIDIEIEAKEE